MNTDADITQLYHVIVDFILECHLTVLQCLFFFLLQWICFYVSHMLKFSRFELF